jgi:hypothetical protein
LVALNGRSIVAKVERFAPHELKSRGGERFVMTITNAHFHWRGGGPDAKWSEHVEVLSVEDFARHASEEVSCEK